METIQQIATTAAKVVWGEGDTSQAHQEPISGVGGDVSKGEPYDAGNIDAAETTELGSSIHGQTDRKVHSQSPDKELHPTRHDENGNNKLRSPEKTGIDAGGLRNSHPDKEVSSDTAVVADSPRPVAVVAKEHGGDAAKSHVFESEETRMAHSPRDDANQESQGTGEQYVKTTGLAADGGNFDATKPGAGREADRIMEEKGWRNGDETLTSKDHENPGKGKNKPSLGERIKNKLHRQ